jgi:hypothetical protein
MNAGVTGVLPSSVHNCLGQAATSRQPGRRETGTLRAGVPVSLEGVTSMSFLEFLESFEGAWLQSDGFLQMALADPALPKVQDLSDLDGWLFVRSTSAKTREDARWFWREYQKSLGKWKVIDAAL